MKKITFLFLLAGSMTFAQRNLTIEEATTGLRTYAPKSMLATQWRKDVKAITYLDNSYQNLVTRSDANQWKETTLLTKDDIQNALKAKFPQDDFALRMFPFAYSWKDQNTLAFEVGGKKANYIVEFDAAQKTIKNILSIPLDAANQLPTETKNRVAWLEKNNIKITDASGKTIAVTNDENAGIVNGSDYTHSQEFGIHQGMWWNKTGDKLLYYRKDETMVTNYPLVDFGARVAAVKDIRYPMAGMKSEEVTLVIFDVASNNKVTLKTGEPKEQFLTCVTWDPTGKFVYVGLLNREQNHLKLNKYDEIGRAHV